MKTWLGVRLHEKLWEWISFTMKDESIPFCHAAQVVIAKITARMASTKRTRITYEDGKFSTQITYTTPDALGFATYIDTPHVEISTEAGIKIGCFTISEPAFIEVLRQLSIFKHRDQERVVVQEGYMPK